MNFDRNQAWVRIMATAPREFRFSANQVRVRRFGLGVLLEPAEIDPDTRFEALDCFEEPFMPKEACSLGPRPGTS